MGLKKSLASRVPDCPNGEHGPMTGIRLAMVGNQSSMTLIQVRGTR